MSSIYGGQRKHLDGFKFHPAMFFTIFEKDIKFKFLLYSVAIKYLWH